MSLRRAFYLSFGRTGGQLFVQFLTNIALARLLAPAEIGVFAVALAFITLLNALRDFGVSRYLIKEKELSEAKLRTVFGLALLVGWGLAAAIFLGRSGVAAFYGEARLGPVLALLALAFLILPFGQPAMALLRRDERHAELAFVTLAASLAGALVSVGLAAAGFGPRAMACGHVTATLLTALLALRARPDHLRLRPGLAEWRAVTGFGVVASAGVIAVQLGLQTPALVIGRLLGFAELGFFQRANGLTSMVNGLIGTATNWVTGAALGTRSRAGAELAPLALAATSGIALVAWPLLLFMALRAEPLVVFLYGAAWAPAAALMVPLALAWAMTAIAGQALALCEGTGAAGLLLRNELLALAVAVLCLVVGARWGIEGAAWSRVPAALALLLIRMTALRRLAGIGTFALALALVRPAAVAAGFGLTLLALARIAPRDLPAALLLPAEAALMAAVFLALVLLVRHPLGAEILGLARRLLRRR
jgi:O-antigen/teichoic acid export membrane protein